MRYAILTCLFLSTATGAASANVIGKVNGTAVEPVREEPLLIGDPGSPVESDDPYVIASFLAQPNLRGIAAAPGIINYRTPSGRSFAFRLRHFDASEGIDVS